LIPESIWLRSLFAIGFTVFGFFVILFFIEVEAKNKEIKSKNILAFFNKYSMVIFGFLNKSSKIFFGFLYKYLMVFGVVFVIIGAVFLIPFLTPWGVNIFWFDWFIKNYFWSIRGPLFLTCILLLEIGLFLIIRYPHPFVTKYSMAIFAFVDKYSMVFGVVFVIIGAVFLIPFLTPWGVNIFWFDWFIKNYFWFIRGPLFLTCILLLEIGLILIINYRRHNSQSALK
jgi:hypothetical protein